MYEDTKKRKLNRWFIASISVSNINDEFETKICNGR